MRNPTLRLLSVLLALMLALPAAGALAESQEERFTITLVSYQMAPIKSAKEHPKVIEFFNEALNVDLQVINIEHNQWNEMLNLKLAAGEIPDILKCNDLATLNRYVEQGVLAEITDEMYQENMPLTWERFQTSHAEYNDIGVVDGKRYGIASYFNFHSQFRTPLVVRGDWLANVGIDKVPETFEEYEEMLRKFTTDDPDGNGKNDTYGLSNDGIVPILAAYGVLAKRTMDDGAGASWWYKEEDGTLVPGYMRQERMRAALEKLAELYADGVIDPEFITGENTGGYWALSHAFINGRIGTTTRGGYYHWNNDRDIAVANIDELQKINPDAVEALVFPQPPVGPYGDCALSQQELCNNATFNFGVQLQDNPEKFAKAMQVIEYISATSMENFLSAYWGILGEMWDYDESGDPVQNADWLDGAKLAAEGGHQVLTHLTFEEFDGYREPYSIRFGEMYGFNENGVRNQFTGNVPAWTEYGADLTKLYDEMLISIITGDKPVSYYDEFVELWLSSGGQQYLDEVNAAVSGT